MKSEKRQRNCIVSVRVSDDELATIQARARAAGQSVSAYMRESTLRHIRQEQGGTETQWAVWTPIKVYRCENRADAEGLLAQARDRGRGVDAKIVSRTVTTSGWNEA